MISEEQRDIEHAARDMLFRDGNDVLETSVANGELAAATKHRLTALQAKIKTTDVGQGSYALLISKLDLKALGFGLRAWEKAETVSLVRPMIHDGMPTYSIDHPLLMAQIQERLEAVTGISLAEAQARHAALRTQKTIAR